jgi:ComF family protein
MSALRLHHAATAVWRPLESLLFPARCWATGVPLKSDERMLCQGAREQIARGLLWPYCAGCGSTAGPGTRFDAGNPCPQCATRDLGVERIVRVGTFDEPLRTLVTTLKFRGRWELARVLAPFVAQALQQATLDGRLGRVDALVPVALHWRRRLRRGFNQSEEIARALGHLTGWPVADVLWRRRATFEQSHTQSRTQRRENLRAAFVSTKPERLAGKHVWLIDDVCTTGATLHAAAMALRRVPKDQRPAGIYAAVVCVTDHTAIPEPPLLPDLTP